MVGRSISNTKITLYQKIRSRCSGSGSSSGSGTISGIRKSPSRFRGVLAVGNHRWGTRISADYKVYWLGTYQMEEEAAIAYDRAALKLQKTNIVLNFPHIINTPQEKSFQSWYSDDEILEMIKDGTYSSNFSSFLAHQALVRETIADSLINSKGLSCKRLFHRELKQTDVTNVEGLHIPKEYALRYLPPLGNSSGNGTQTESDPIDITFYDKNYVCWTFRYSYLVIIQVFCFTKGWKDFVTMNNLNSGDTVIFYGCHHVDHAGQRGMFYMIDIHRNGPENHIVGEGGEQGFGSYVDGIKGVDQNNGVKLFGVKIG
ncbi:hypothetical protein GQ457_15G010760 [Hibiscus cannabinus]